MGIKHTDLLPCPFCKTEATSEHTICDSSVYCTSALCHAKIVMGNSRRLTPRENVERVIAAWNTRKADCHEEVDEMLREVAPQWRDQFFVIKQKLKRWPSHQDLTAVGELIKLTSFILSELENAALAHATNKESN